MVARAIQTSDDKYKVVKISKFPVYTGIWFLVYFIFVTTHRDSTIIQSTFLFILIAVVQQRESASRTRTYQLAGLETT